MGEKGRGAECHLPDLPGKGSLATSASDMVQVFVIFERNSHGVAERSVEWLINGCFVGLSIAIVTVAMDVGANLMPLPPMDFAKPWAPDILKKGTLMIPVWMD
jgi:hypothetical protein